MAYRLLWWDMTAMILIGICIYIYIFIWYELIWYTSWLRKKHLLCGFYMGIFICAMVKRRYERLQLRSAITTQNMWFTVCSDRGPCVAIHLFRHRIFVQSQSIPLIFLLVTFLQSRRQIWQRWSRNGHQFLTITVMKMINQMMLAPSWLQVHHDMFPFPT